MRSNRGELYCAFTISKALKYRCKVNGSVPLRDTDGLVILAEMCSSTNPKTRNIALRGLREILVVSSLDQATWQIVCQATVGVFASTENETQARIEAGSVVSKRKTSTRRQTKTKWAEVTSLNECMNALISTTILH